MPKFPSVKIYFTAVFVTDYGDSIQMLKNVKVYSSQKNTVYNKPRLRYSLLQGIISVPHIL